MLNMNIESILSPERTRANVAATSRKKALEEVANLIHQSMPELPADELFAKLIERERLGTTAVGHGIAIPHCRLEECSSITGALFQFPEGIDFDAFDNEPVQILFVLLVPSAEVDEHLKVLAMLAERLEDESFRKALKSARTDAELHAAALRGSTLRARSA